ncbi:MAG: hypothetical protein JKY56_22590 [Kofleriaceae bacterium]|nr:hypothetical protein [Kofleriaceae bacterium]
MDKACSHGMDAQNCPQCTECDHDVILNGACFYCGATDVKADIKGEAKLIPVSELTRHRD